MLDWLRMGGYAVWPTIGFGFLTIGAALRYAWALDRRLVPLVVSGGVLTLLTGAGGCVTGITKSLTALTEVPSDKHWIGAVGVGESLVCIGLAVLLASVAAMAMTVGAWKLARRPARP